MMSSSRRIQNPVLPDNAIEATEGADVAAAVNAAVSAVQYDAATLSCTTWRNDRPADRRIGDLAAWRLGGSEDRRIDNRRLGGSADLYRIGGYAARGIGLSCYVLLEH